MFEEEIPLTLDVNGEAVLPAEGYKVRRVFVGKANASFLARGNKIKVREAQNMQVTVVMNVMKPLPVEFPPETTEAVQWLSLAKATGDQAARFNYMSARGELSRMLNQSGRTPMLYHYQQWIP
jgi:hypothetical protein